MVAVYHAELAEAQADADIAALMARGTARSPFDRLDWLRMLADACLPGERCFLAVARDGDAMAVLPLMQDNDGVRSLANWYSFTARPVWNAESKAPRLLAAIAQSLTPAGAARLSALPEMEAQAMAAALREAGWIAQMAQCDVNHILNLRGRSFAEYWTARPGALRETVRRKGKKGVVALRIASVFDSADWDAYETVYRLSWKPGEGSPAFLRQWAEDESAAGSLRLGIAEIKGQPVAAQFWTVEAGTAFIHKLAHDERAKAHSPGTLLSAAMFEQVIDRDGVALVDFGTGNDPYKRDWMEAVRPRFAIEAYRAGAVRHWKGLARLVGRRVLRGGASGEQALVSARAAG